jgi:hypothetical protein
MKPTTYCHKKAMGSYCFVFTFIFLTISFPVQAEEKDKFQAEIATDIVSQSIWRGVYQAGASIQPSWTVGYKNVELYAWGTSDFWSAGREIDFTLTYAFRGFTVGITDYWCGDSIDKYRHNHQFEGNLKYEFESIPLSLEWNTVFAGETRSYVFSSYAEINYGLKLAAVDFNFSLGLTPWKNQMLETTGFAVSNLSVTAGKQFSILSLCNMTSACILLYNPYADRLYFITKIGFNIF